MPLRNRRKKEEEDDSVKAVEEASESLKRVKARSAEVLAVSSALRRRREVNHFAEGLQILIEGHR